MLKAKEFKVEDSNVEGLGGDEDRALRKGAAQTEPAWKHWKKYLDGSILKEDTARNGHHVEVWRIEKFKVKFWPREKHGQFYSGDSYLILHTFEEEDKLNWDLHFWLGKDTTQDEMGTAAYKTVELDTLLDDGPIQRREVQGHESQKFHDIFGKYMECGGLTYLEGGVDSGFKHVEPESYKPRLLHLKGKKKVRVMQVPLEVGSLNSGDLFILDMGLDIYVFTGAKAGMFEKNKGREFSAAIRTERKGKANVHNFREGDDGEEATAFFKALNATPDVAIKSAAEGGSDVEETEKATKKILFRLSDATGTLKFTKEGEGSAVTSSSLDSNDVFVLDVGYQVFAYVGKNSSQQEKDKAIENAEKYLKDQGRPSHTPIVRVLEGQRFGEFDTAINGGV